MMGVMGRWRSRREKIKERFRKGYCRNWSRGVLDSRGRERLVVIMGMLSRG